MFSSTLVVFLVLRGISSYILPADLPVCYRSSPNLTNCLADFFNSFRPYCKKGLREINLPPFDPLLIGNVNITHYSQGTQFVVSFRDFVYYDIKGYKVTHVQLTEAGITVHVELGNIRLTTYFDVDGKFLNVPLRGNGFAQVVQINSSAKIITASDIIQKNGIDFCNISNLNFIMKVKDADINLIGLDKKGATSEFLNANSKEVAKLMGDVLAKVLGLHFKKYITGLCNNVPLNNFSPIF